MVVAKDIVFKKSYYWIVDEMMPADGSQTVYMSENMMKTFLTPLAPASIRCRNSDLVLPAGMPRIITANATSAEERCGYCCKWSKPLERKSIVFVIKKPLCNDRWRRGLVENAEENDDDCDDAVKIMRDSVAGRFAPPPAAPPSVAGRWASALRGVFGSGAASSSSSNP